mgnify:CR=1 FL=1
MKEVYFGVQHHAGTHRAVYFTGSVNYFTASINYLRTPLKTNNGTQMTQMLQIYTDKIRENQSR